jgi:hypothetical protein
MPRTVHLPTPRPSFESLIERLRIPKARQAELMAMVRGETEVGAAEAQPAQPTRGNVSAILREIDREIEKLQEAQRRLGGRIEKTAVRRKLSLQARRKVSAAIRRAEAQRGDVIKGSV